MSSIEFEERDTFDGLKKSFTRHRFLVVFRAANLTKFCFENGQFQWNFTVIFRVSKSIVGNTDRDYTTLAKYFRSRYPFT